MDNFKKSVYPNQKMSAKARILASVAVETRQQQQIKIVFASPSPQMRLIGHTTIVMVHHMYSWRLIKGAMMIREL
ncbi:hypothetical protein [Desulfosediminicola flagellatus]|uniref:hypothetical protein n=1 Tax=Desulfosediminicola flagellatus TaxID=2569541 RepID=UPI0010AB6776|nr:hypothetical protein [Desulfosediminicola flagellatus]